MGKNVYFGEGAYQPENNQGLRRIGHELAHVVQQTRGVNNEVLSATGDRWEREAERAADSFVLGRRAQLAAPPSIGRHSSAHAFTALQREKKGEHPAPPDPQLSASVGRNCENRVEDVKTIQRMLKLDPTGDPDETLFKAIEAFQRQIDGIKPDGKISLPNPNGRGKAGTTWKELFKRETGRYPGAESAPGTTGPATTGASSQSTASKPSRPVFGRKQSIMLGADDNAATVEVGDKHYDGNSDGLDDATTNMREAAEKAPGIVAHQVGNTAEATAVLQDYHDNSTSIDTLVISSHGYRERPNFFLGNDEINSGNVEDKLLPWRPLLNDETNVIVKSCNTGGGVKPEKGKSFTNKLAATLNVTVYTSRSWAVSKTDSFSDMPASWYGAPSTWDAGDVKKYEEPYRNMGLWLKATPEDVAVRKAAILAEYAARYGLSFDEAAYVLDAKKTKEVYSPVLQEDGSFTISETRFPTLSEEDRDAFDNYEWPR